MLSSCMDSITTEPPETTFHVMVCCLPLGSLASHCPARAFRLSNDALALGTDKTGTEIAKNTIATATALSFICFPPALTERCVHDFVLNWASLLYLFTIFGGSFKWHDKPVSGKGACSRAAQIRNKDCPQIGAAREHLSAEKNYLSGSTTFFSPAM